MNKTWVISIFLLSTFLLLTLKSLEKRTLIPYFKAERTLKLQHFESARARVDPKDLHLLELWESMLTGRVAPLDRWLRNEFKTLSLAHVFTPSGFHLSAVLWPVLLVLKKKSYRLAVLGMIGFLLSFLPGLSALKRMTLMKFNQQILGSRTGFVCAFAIDLLIGSFSGSPLGFTYSFLFLGVIYSGARGLTLFIWFFLAQMLISFVQGSMISPLLLLISPLINTVLAFILPPLFVFAWPLTDWQLSAGIFLIRIAQVLVSHCYQLVMNFPLLEMNIALLFLFIFLIQRKGRLTLLLAMLVTADLNSDKGKIPMAATYEWQASGRIIRMTDSKIYKMDGICERRLVRGIWYETCSPRRRSRKKGLKKLSYLSEEQRMSSLHGSRT